MNTYGGQNVGNYNQLSLGQPDLKIQTYVRPNITLPEIEIKNIFNPTTISHSNIINNNAFQC